MHDASAPKGPSADAMRGTPLSSFSQKSPASKAGAGFKSVASAVIQSQARRGGEDTAAAPAADSRAASQSRLYAGTASSEAKRREMLLRAQKEAAAEDGMVRISPEDLAAMRAEIAALRENVQKLQPLDPENAQLKRSLQATQRDGKQVKDDYDNLKAEAKVLNQIIERLQGVEGNNSQLQSDAESLKSELEQAERRCESLRAGAQQGQDKSMKEAQLQEQKLADARAAQAKQQQDALAAQAKLQQDIAALQRQLNAASTNRDSYQQQGEQLTSRLNQTTASLERSEQHGREAEQQSRGQQQQLATMTALRDTAQQRGDQMAKQLREVTNEHEKCQQQLALAEGQGSRLLADQAQWVKEKIALQQSLADQGVAGRKLETDLQALRHQLNGLTQEKGVWQQDKRILQQHMSSESAARTAAEQQVQALQRQLSTATADCTNCKEDKEALQQQVALLKLASQDDMAALQKQLANVIAERDVGHEQIKAAEQQAAAETAHRVRVEGSAHDVQQQLSRQTAEAGKTQQACKKLHEQAQQEELARMAAEHAQKAAEQRLAEAVSDAQQAERDDNAVQRRLADQAGTIMGLQHSLQSAQADLHKFHSAHARFKEEAEGAFAELKEQVASAHQDRHALEQQAKDQMVELEETFITQLQRVADTYKREMQEQHSIKSDLEVRLRAAQLAVHQADTRCEDAQAALHTLQAHPPPVEVGTETDGELQEVQAALEAQRSQAHALKRRILELQEHLRRASQVSSALESRVRQEGRTEAQAHAQAQIQALKQGRAEAQAAAQTQIQALLQEREDLQEELQRLAGQLAGCSSPRVDAHPYLEAPLHSRKATHLKRPVRLCRVRKESSSASETRRRPEGHTADHVWRVPGVAPTSLDGLLALKQPTRLPAKFSFAHHARRTSTAPARSRRQHRQDSDQEPSRSSSQERAERKAEVRAAKRAAKEEALEREWKVQQVAGELGRQADLLERHRYLVAKYGAPDALGHLDGGEMQEASSPLGSPRLQPGRDQPSPVFQDRTSPTGNAACMSLAELSLGQQPRPAGHASHRLTSAPTGTNQEYQQRQQGVQQGGQEVPPQVRHFAAHYAGDEGLARPFSAMPSDRNLAWGDQPSSSDRPAMRHRPESGQPAAVQAAVTRQAWQADSLGEARDERTWSAPAQSNTRQWNMVGDSAQHDGVPSAVQQRAAQYAGDEGLARPPTRPPSDWRSRQHQPHADDPPTTGEQPSQSFDRVTEQAVWRCLQQAGLLDQDSGQSALGTETTVSHRPMATPDSRQTVKRNVVSKSTKEKKASKSASHDRSRVIMV
ncbi:hypothetical protein WJX82_006566 [Trebouxia sp. C0006]